MKNLLSQLTYWVRTLIWFGLVHGFLRKAGKTMHLRTGRSEIQHALNCAVRFGFSIKTQVIVIGGTPKWQCRSTPIHAKEWGDDLAIKECSGVSCFALPDQRYVDRPISFLSIDVLLNGSIPANDGALLILVGDHIDLLAASRLAQANEGLSVIHITEKPNEHNVHFDMSFDARTWVPSLGKLA